jgi:hypothetical protein
MLAILTMAAQSPPPLWYKYFLKIKKGGSGEGGRKGEEFNNLVVP